MLVIISIQSSTSSTSSTTTQDVKSYVTITVIIDISKIDLVKKYSSKPFLIDKCVILPSDIFLIEYTDKAVAVFGDTKSIKDQLKQIGGRFNAYLTHNGEKRAGWIFPKTKSEELKKLIK